MLLVDSCLQSHSCNQSFGLQLCVCDALFPPFSVAQVTLMTDSYFANDIGGGWYLGGDLHVWM